MWSGDWETYDWQYIGIKAILVGIAIWSILVLALLVPQCVNISRNWLVNETINRHR